MPFTFKDIDFRVDLPQLPRSMPLVRTVTPCTPERMPAMQRLSRHLELDDAAEVDLPFGSALASKRGQVELFAASGAIRARDLDVINAFPDEERKWPGAERLDDETWTLDDNARRGIQDRAAELFRSLELGAEPAGVDVSIGQWARLSKTGKVLESGPGRATVSFRYEFEGTPFIGAGAKTSLHYDPIDGVPRLARFFHVLRQNPDARSVDIGDTEQAFAGLVDDPFLVAHARGRVKVAVTSVTVGLLALPADQSQSWSVPTIRTEGVLEGVLDKKKERFPVRFARYIPMVRPESLAAAGVVLSPTLQPSLVNRITKAPKGR